MFNCAFLNCETVNDFVDAYWLLLQGCGVGFKPVVGCLNGFANEVPTIEIRGSLISREMWDAGHKGGTENVVDYDEYTGRWLLIVGDSAEAWAKAVGKLLAMKHPVKKIVLDFSQIRPAGIRLKGYGWISSGYVPFSNALLSICNILSRRADSLLSAVDILDIGNHLGMTLTSRRSAEMMVYEYGGPEWKAFANAKRDYWDTGNEQRGQSNNSLIFNTRPTEAELEQVLRMMVDSGGSEPGIINGAAARKRAPWFSGTNPCGEILLPSHGFCNLVEINLPYFNDRPIEELWRAVHIAARANYRQTCVNLKDGILQSRWHENNEFLRLCGVGMTGIAQSSYWTAGNMMTFRNIAQDSANDMADELKLPRPKSVTTIKPSGTQAKRMDVTEGIHKPLGRFIFNWIGFSRHDPLIDTLDRAGYRIRQNPTDKESFIVCLPVEYSGVEFSSVLLSDGRTVEVNTDTAVEQLERYREAMQYYVDHNCSVTVSYDPVELSAITEWLMRNWDNYVAVSFLPRVDPTKTAADLGYQYLPQEVVSEDEYNEYVRGLGPVMFDGRGGDFVVSVDECSSGACPVR